MSDFLANIKGLDVIDVAVAAVILYMLFLWLKRTKAVFVLIGIIISGIGYIAVKLLKLQLVAALLEGFFAVILVAIVVIFQNEIKRLFEKIAVWSLGKKVKRRSSPGVLKQADIIVDTIFDLSREKTGALVVLVGKEPVARHIQGGTELEGILSAPLLKSIFDTHSDGHDGAVLVEGGKVSRFACQLPLSRDVKKIEKKGTRHAAALGLSELTDALCIVVSEQTGAVSVNRFGEVQRISSRQQLLEILENFQREFIPVRPTRSIRKAFTANLKEKFAAVCISVILWFVFVYGSSMVYRAFDIPVHSVGLADNLELRDMEPKEVKVVLSARRRDFYLVDKKDVELSLKLFDLSALKKGEKKGYYERTITASDVAIPAGTTIVNIVPRTVRLYVEEKVPAAGS